jgi:predicted acylesterase/phospholipase RssA
VKLWKKKDPAIGLAIAGGGCKAFFALGVAESFRREGFKFSAISATSAGTAMGIAVINQKADEAVDYFCQLTARNPSNFNLKRLLSGENPFPHEQMYRETIAKIIDIKTFKRNQVSLAFNALSMPYYDSLEEKKWRRKLFFQLFSAYRKEIRDANSGRFYPYMYDVARKFALKEVIFTEEDFFDARKIEDIVLATSSAPPVVMTQQRDSVLYLDGGIIDNLPVRLLPDLDLTIAIYYQPSTRRILEYHNRQQSRNILWIHPDGKLPVTVWDYTNPDGVRKTYELGLEAGENHIRLLRQFLKK